MRFITPEKFGARDLLLCKSPGCAQDGIGPRDSKGQLPISGTGKSNQKQRRKPQPRSHGGTKPLLSIAAGTSEYFRMVLKHSQRYGLGRQLLLG